MKTRLVLAGEVYICNLGETVGSEQGGNKRPVAIVSNSKACYFSDVVYIIPITSKSKNFLPQHYTLHKKDFPYLKYEENTALCEQARPVSKKRLQNKIGEISPSILKELITCVKNNFPK